MKSLKFATKGWIFSILVLVLGSGVGTYSFSQSSERSACPGQIVCPLTGEEVCVDECPLIDTSRKDCPGKIECPLTGELVCRDRCPLGSAAAATDSASELPPCCRNR